MNGRNWKVLFTPGTTYHYVSGRCKGKFRKKEDIETIARQETNLMFIPCTVERTTVSEDQNPNLWN